jgi:hypothetical protein
MRDCRWSISRAGASRIGKVAQGVAEDADGRYRQANPERRRDDQPGRGLKVQPPAVDHGSPFGLRWLDPQAEKAR